MVRRVMPDISLNSSLMLDLVPGISECLQIHFLTHHISCVTSAHSLIPGIGLSVSELFGDGPWC